MSLTAFLADLFDSGQVRVPAPDRAPDQLDPEQASQITDLLASYENDDRLEFPGNAPKYDTGPGLWAARMFYRASQSIAFRELGEAEINQLLSLECPERQSATAHYSVDLIFRFLGDLIKLASGIADQDPVLVHLRRWCADWPLSSVGVGDIQISSIDPIINHPGLLAVYVDRIITTGDVSRLDHDKVSDAVRAAIGAYPQLAPKLGPALNPQPAKTPDKESDQSALLDVPDATDQEAAARDTQRDAEQADKDFIDE